MSLYTVKTILFRTGERFPMLIDDKTGMPDYWSTVFSITQYRSKGSAANTIEQILRHLIILNLFLKHNYPEEIDIEKRLQKGRLLSLHEIESLCDLCTLKLEDITKLYTQRKPSKQNLKLSSMEAFRSNKSQIQISTVGTATAGNRIRGIKNFLIWRINVYAATLEEYDNNLHSLTEVKQLVASSFSSRIPTTSHNTSETEPMGLSKEAISKLFTAISKNSPENPWKNEFTKARNELLVLWLYQFGLRRGELLNLKISDLDFRSEQFNVKRRPHDLDDPRKKQPNVKTRERRIAIPEKILRLTQDYILNHRTHLPEAKKHEFLFVASKTGKPMALDTANKIFSKLKKTYPDIFTFLFPHILRHTWNDNFSEAMDKQQVPEEKEKKIRSYLMGWSESSESAETYTKRHIRNKANAAILDMANNLIKGTSSKEGDR